MKKFEISKCTILSFCKIDSNGCWLWQKSLKGKGYAQVTDPKTGRQDYGHHVTWRMFNKRRIPKGYILRHSCDVRRCINPMHIIPGTYSQNNKETWARHNERELRRLSVTLRVTRGVLKNAFAKGRKIGAPRGLKAINSK